MLPAGLLRGLKLPPTSRTLHAHSCGPGAGPWPLAPVTGTDLILSCSIIWKTDPMLQTQLISPGLCKGSPTPTSHSAPLAPPELRGEAEKAAVGKGVSWCWNQ